MVRAPAKKAPTAGVVPLRPQRKCPICGRPAVRAYYPFDSKRCADLDLGKWLGGGYVIPATEETPDEDDVRQGKDRDRGQDD